MNQDRSPLFAFSEADHLTRIHLRLALEDIGFTVAEEADALLLTGDGADTGSEPSPAGGQ